MKLRLVCFNGTDLGIYIDLPAPIIKERERESLGIYLCCNGDNTPADERGQCSSTCTRFLRKGISLPQTRHRHRNFQMQYLRSIYDMSVWFIFHKTFPRMVDLSSVRRGSSYILAADKTRVVK